MTTIQDITSPMSSSEKYATMSLAGIYALRMLGLFMILPVLSLFASQLEGSTPALIGLAMSIYGLPQVLLQIPFGLLSDRFGRKRVIAFGLVLFFIGSVIAALSTTIFGVLIGRAFQGAGAISSVIMALVADLTQEVHRTKAMATIGISIGLSFGAGIVLGPIISDFGGVQAVFWASSLLTVFAMFSLFYLVPNPGHSKVHRDAEFVPHEALKALKNPDLLRLDYGIFILHMILMAQFVVIPPLMRQAGLQAGNEWQVYLPVFIVAMAFVVPFVIIAEKKRKMKQVFMGAIAVLILAETGLSLFHTQLFTIVSFLGLFFCGFNLLEATLPSLVSKTAPADLKGTAMGAYSSCQFTGLFLGGLIGGWFNGLYGVTAVFILCAVAALSWLVLATGMNPPRYLSSLLISLEELSEPVISEFVGKMQALAGVEEVLVHTDDMVAYLKIDNQVIKTEQLQALVTEYTQT